MESRKIAARYKFEHEGVLSSYGGPYKDANGKSLDSLVLRRGDTVMVNEHEVKGYTVLRDPRHEKEPEMLGIGRVAKQEHQQLSDEELHTIGYQFHQGSPMWEEVFPVVPEKKNTKEQKEGAN